MNIITFFAVIWCIALFVVMIVLSNKALRTCKKIEKDIDEMQISVAKMKKKIKCLDAEVKDA